MKNEKKSKLSSFLMNDTKSVEKKTSFLKKITDEREKIVAIMRLSDKKALNYFNQTKNVEKEVKPKKEITFNIFTKIKSYFKNLLFKYLIEPEIKRIEEEKFKLEQAKKDALNKAVIKNFYDTNIETRTRFNEILAKIRKESGGKSYGKVPMLFDPEACISHNDNTERLLNPSISEIIKHENSRADKVLKQQGIPNFTKNKVDLMMKKRIVINEQ